MATSYGTTPVFPPALPYVASMSWSPTDQILTSDDNVGPKDFRRISRVPGADAQVTWELNAEQFQTLRQFWLTTLKRGNKWFLLPLPSAATSSRHALHVVRFVTPFKRELNGNGFHVISTDLDVLERKFDPFNCDAALQLGQDSIDNVVYIYETYLSNIAPNGTTEEGVYYHNRSSGPIPDSGPWNMPWTRTWSALHSPSEADVFSWSRAGGAAPAPYPYITFTISDVPSDDQECKIIVAQTYGGWRNCKVLVNGSDLGYVHWYSDGSAGKLVAVILLINNYGVLSAELLNPGAEYIPS